MTELLLLKKYTITFICSARVRVESCLIKVQIAKTKNKKTKKKKKLGSHSESLVTCYKLTKCRPATFNFNMIYSRTSVARTLMARLPRLFRTRSLVPWNGRLRIINLRLFFFTF